MSTTQQAPRRQEPALIRQRRRGILFFVSGMGGYTVGIRLVVIVVVGMQRFRSRTINGKLRQLIVDYEIGRNGLAGRHEFLQNGAQVLINQVTAIAIGGTVTTHPFRNGIE
jgi:hypothetical protein